MNRGNVIALFLGSHAFPFNYSIVLYRVFHDNTLV
jgi:hypothetical protein